MNNHSNLIKPADLGVQDEGSIVLLHPLNDDAEKWIETNLPDVQPWQRFGLAIAVEHRFIADIVEGIRADGMIVKDIRL
jgi:hypothetical protein